MTPERAAEPPVTIFILARNRPLYLWASLESFYRGTQYPHRFILVDMASEDPLVPQVIAGFARRGMLDEVVTMPRNDLADYWKLLWKRLPELGPYFVHLEADVVVEATTPCWLGRFVALMAADPRLAMLGSAIDKRDFVDPVEARRREPARDEQQLQQLIKLESPERQQDLGAAAGQSIFRPYNPAGRFVMLRSYALALVGADDDVGLDRKLRDAGCQTGIATGVRHRHLSLLHIYDYPRYDYAEREAFLRGRR